MALGVVGHVDHGKTALVRALTGMETDRLPEEKARGVSMVLGFAHALFAEAEVDFIDMPGHERFVRAMVSGATGVAAVLLVVAANEGVKPQTVEHLEISALLGVVRVLPVISKADLVDADEAAAMGETVVALIGDYSLVAERPIAVSAQDGSGLEALRRAIGGLASVLPEPEDDGFPWLPIDRAFTVAGRGTVVTGTLRRGRLRATDALSLLPGGAEVRVRGLQVHGEAVAEAAPGQRLAVNLRGLEPAEAPRGAALAAPGALASAERLLVELQAARSGEALRSGTRLNLSFGAMEVPARLRLLGRGTLEPGERSFAELTAAEPVFVPARERFVLRLPSPPRTVGGGRVVEPGARRVRRADPSALERLSRLAAASPGEAVRLTLAAAGGRGAPGARLQALAGLGPGRFAGLLKAERAWRLADGLVLSHAAAQALGERVAATLHAEAERQPNGLNRRRLAALLPGASPGALEGVVSALAAAGRVRAEGGMVRLAPRRADEAARAADEVALAEAMRRRLKAAGLAPPDLAELAPTPAARRALERLLKDGGAVHTFDRVQKRELLFHPEAVADARARLEPHLQPPGLTVGEAGALLGITRKFSVPLLEYLDMVRFTRREGDRRVLGRA